MTRRKRRNKSRWGPVGRRFRRRDPIEAALEFAAVEAKAGRELREALHRAGEAMVLHGEVPTAESVVSRFMMLAQGEIDIDDSAVAYSCYLLLRAQQSWWSGMPVDALRAFWGPTARRISAGQHPMWLKQMLAAQAVKTVEAVRTLDSVTRSFFVADAKALVASIFCEGPDADERELGLELMAEQVEVMKELLLRSDSHDLNDSFGSMYGQALNNLAQSWSDRIQGDRESNLRRAIHFYKEVIELPARRREPARLRWSLHYLAMRERGLALTIEDDAEKRELLESALAHHEEASKLPGEWPGSPPGHLEGTTMAHFSVRLDLLEARSKAGLLDETDAARSIVVLADEMLSWMSRAFSRSKSPFQITRDRFRRARSDARVVLGCKPEAPADESASVLEIVESLARKIARERPDRRAVHLSREDARDLYNSLVAWPAQMPWPRERWGQLGILMGAVHPLHVGMLSLSLFLLEANLLMRAAQDERAMLMEHVNQGIKNSHAKMRAPDLADAHRRAFAGSIRALASVALSWCDDDVAPQQRAYWFDLLGAAVYRADMGFYGQGPTAEFCPDTEAGWRMNLYRAREELDRCSHISMLEEVRRLPPERLGEDIDMLREGLQSLITALSTITDLDPKEKVRGVNKLSNPEGTSAEVRDEIGKRWQVGVDRGWAPGCGPTVPVPDPDEIASWLRDNRDVGILLNGAFVGVVGICTGCAGELVSTDLLGEEDPSALASSVAEYSENLYQGAGGEFDPESIKSFNNALSGLLEGEFADRVGTRLLAWAREHRLRALLVLSRGEVRLVPWGSLQSEHGRTLGDVLDIVHVPTLAGLGATVEANSDKICAYIGAKTGEDRGLDFGRAAITPLSEEVAGPTKRADFERMCTDAGVLRIFTHAKADLWIASRSRLYLNEAQQSKFPYRAFEVGMLDLRHCRRVELWACESGFSNDNLGDLLGQDEALGLPGFFLLAGAQVVIGSLWPQPADSAALIAAGFAARSVVAAGARADASALAQAVRAYREAVAEGGVFEQGVARAIREHLRAGDKNRVLGEAFRQGWEDAYQTITGVHAELPESTWHAYEERGRSV